MPTFNELREQARLLNVPEATISMAYDKQDLSNAIKQVDARARALQVGVPAREISLAYDRAELCEVTGA